ncbi:unnamed protein product [Mytilus edulis]|uniref:B box-type domain-containing protein n=1 Tax=Mytilus edulis TaxID=6550 RepID=A0A8S3TH03_MYTED|nr:unnamed protein product [Mytilus edulis]
MKQLEGDVDEICQFIESLFESDVLNRVGIKCNISSSLTDIANLVPVFGKVYIESASKSVSITKKKQQQAQLVLPRALSVPVETIQVELQQTIENKSHVRGCCILPEGRFVLTYPDLNKIEIVKEDGSADFSLNVAAAYGVAYHDADNTLAISSWWFNGVGAQITIIDLTHYEYDIVVCCDLKGTPIWTFKNESALSYPSEISAEYDGNVFVMMASSEPSCAVCEFQHVLTFASIWCSDCDEGLCIDCSKHHGISKATRKHVTIPISEYKTLPTYITNIKQTCSTHDEKYMIYCNEHECACCNDVVKNTKTSNAFLEIHESVNEVAENIKRIRQDKNNNLKTLSEQRKQIERDVQQLSEHCEEKQQQAQLIVPKVSSIVPIENIQVKLEQTIKTESSYISGCCILPDSRFVFAYPGLDKVIVVKQDGTVDFVLNITAAYGIAYNNEDNTLAISSWWRSQGKQITIIDLKGRRVKKTFSPGGQTVGIAVTNNKLLYYIKNKAIRVMDLTDESTRDITTENMDTEINITISGHKLYYSTYNYHTVICYDLQGGKQWTFKKENVLKFPAGISTDNDGNVYVVGRGSNNVVVISPDGQTHKELLTKRDGLYHPWSINFRKETNQLLVANDCQKSVFV